MPRFYRVAGPSRGQPHIFIATAGYTFHPNYTASLAEACMILPQQGIGVSVGILSGHCHVDDARNALLAEFLQTDCTDLVFIDNDVGFGAESLLKLARAPRDFVAGIYPLKQREEDYPVLMEPGQPIWSDADGLVEARGVPTGFLKLSRRCIETMVEKFGERKYMSRGARAGDKPECIIFERTFENGRRFSGDYAFCMKWKSLGEKIYVIPTLQLSHHGEQEWVGNVGDFWKRRHGVTEQETFEKMGHAIDALRAGNATPETFNDLFAAWGNQAAAKVEILTALWELGRGNKGPVLELGCGVSSIVLALANPDVEVQAIENDPVWSSKLNYFLEKHEIKNVRVHWAPITAYPEGKWYDIKRIPAQNYSLVFCDGPWRSLGDRSMLFRLAAPMIADAMVIVDDVLIDADHAKALNEWAGATSHRNVQLGQNHPFVISAPVVMEAAE